MPHAAQVAQVAACERLLQPQVTHVIAMLHFTRETADAPRLVDLSGQKLVERVVTRVECCCCAHTDTLAQDGRARVFNPAHS